MQTDALFGRLGARVIMAGVLALALLVALGLLIGRQIAARILGEQEPLSVLAFSFIYGISTIGLVCNYLLHMTKIEIALPLTYAALILIYVGLRRARLAPAKAPPRLGALERAVVIAACVVGVAPVAAIAYWTNFDELGAHLPWATMLARGVYPPRHVELMECRLGYHFAYDLLSAITHRLSRAPMDEIFDALSVSLCVAFFLGMGGLIRRSSRDRALPWILMIGVLLMGGTYWIRGVFDPQFQWLVRGKLDGYDILAPTTGYYMQQPMLTGLAVFPGVLALYLAAEERASARYAALAGVFLGFLELCEYPLFVMTIAATVAFGFAMPILERRLPKWREIRARIIFLGTGVGLALMNGGFLSRSNRMESAIALGLHLPFFERASAAQSSPWLQYLWQFGVPLVVAPIATYWTIRSRKRFAVWILLLAWGSFALPHLMSYSISNDGTKVFNFARIGFMLAFMAHLGERLEKRGRAFAAACVLVLLVGLSGDGVMRLRYFGAGPKPPRIAANPDESSRMDYEAAQWLEARAGLYDRVLSYDYHLSSYGGIFSYIAWFVGRSDITIRIHGCEPEKILFAEKNTKQAMETLDAASLLALGVRWVYLTEKDLSRLGEAAQERLAGGRFKLVYDERRGARRRQIYMYLDGPPRRDQL